MIEKTLILSGLEPLVVSEKSNFINIGERTNVTGSKKFLRLIEEDKLEDIKTENSNKKETESQREESENNWKNWDEG